MGGEVVAICVKMKDGSIKELTNGMHIRVIEFYKLKFEDVATTGWLLDNGNYVWR